ncbi:MAG: hypothetical protein JWQ35_1931 [Bacteriovoracaceae bacterium]|nr:hypothetical protein [Bacteriovoracaceae bacterium]
MIASLAMPGVSPQLNAATRGVVNKRTLNFFLPIDHISLPCFMPIEIRGAYNSYAGDSSIFGTKWTFNHNIHVAPDRTRFKVMEGDGFENYYTREKNLEEAKKTLADAIIIAQKKLDSKKGGLKAGNVYDDLKRKLLSDQAFRDEQEAKLLSAPKPLGAGIYYSFSKGPSTLEMKPDGTFVRTFQNKSAEYFNPGGQLVKAADKYGNALSYTYSGKNLVRINDACGGSVSFSYVSTKALEGLVQSLRDSLGREIKYEFFPNRRLKSFRNVQKELVEFTYDTIGNMLTLSITKPPQFTKDVQKETVQLAYNAQYEVTKETQPDGREIKYSRSFVANNPNHSLTEISEFQKGKLISREIQEAKLKEFESITKFDGNGKELGKETKKLSPTTGYTTSDLDEHGRGELIDYDANTGNPLRRETVPSGEITEFEYNLGCNQVSKVKTKRAGAVTSEANFNYDVQCNPIKANELEKGKKTVDISLAWNKQGKISFLTDELAKKQIAFTYWKFGKTESITLKDVGTLLVKYSPAGDIEKVDTFPNGKGKDRFKTTDTIAANGVILQEVKSTLDAIMSHLKPSGINIGL